MAIGGPDNDCSLTDRQDPLGTKAKLLQEVLGEARARQRRDFGALLRPRPDDPYPDTLDRAWAGMTSPTGRSCLVVFGRLREDAEQRLWPGFRREATTDWLEPLREGMATVGRPALATLVLAVIRGLVMDLDATGDVDRTSAAWSHFVDGIRVSVGLSTPAGG